MNRTAQFVSCKGVFQGGGCRGVALAGAFAEAHDAGVRFSEVAGTSAGSIVAALVGAGASPDFLLDATKNFDYLSFLVPPTSIEWKRNLRTRFAELFAPVLHRDLKKFFKHGGMYSSRKIEQWIEEQLVKLIPGVQGKVNFADLPTPTHVVAANVFSREPKVWSSHETPNASVAFAVRASCSIPVFFQPVVEGSTIYVDGGILSNLPLFIFNHLDTDSRQIYERTLAFTLSSNRQNSGVLDSIQHLLELVDLSIEGATRIQKNLQPAVNAIDTNTGDLSATDFDKMNESSAEELILKGRTNQIGRLIAHGVVAFPRMTVSHIGPLTFDVADRGLNRFRLAQGARTDQSRKPINVQSQILFDRVAVDWHRSRGI